MQSLGSPGCSDIAWYWQIQYILPTRWHISGIYSSKTNTFAMLTNCSVSPSAWNISKHAWKIMGCEHFWDRVWVHFFNFLYQGCRKRNVLVWMKLRGLWRPDGQLGRPFWAKPVLRRFSGPRIGSVRSSSNVDDFVSCWGKRGACPELLEPGWS
jgi:hypothetical protein